MKLNALLKLTLAIFVLLVSFSSCEEEDLVTEISSPEAVERFQAAPSNLTAAIIDQTIVELNWDALSSVEAYTVDISTDASFGSIDRSLSVTADQLPLRESLDPEVLYFIRVKASGESNSMDSEWDEVSIMTLTNDLFLPFEAGDVAAFDVRFRWVPGTEVTHITIAPGDIRHDITEDEKMNGSAVVGGLTPESPYTATMHDSDRTRGTIAFTTDIDYGGTVVAPGQDLSDAVDAADPGDVLILLAGDHTSEGKLVLTKPITIQGFDPDNKPLLNLDIEIETGGTNVKLINLDIGGDGEQYAVEYDASGVYDSLFIMNCDFHNFERSFLRGNKDETTVQYIHVEDCTVNTVTWKSADFIDWRKGNCLNWVIRNNTFINCSESRDFFRLDDNGVLAGTGAHYNLLFENNTIYQGATKEFLDVDFVTNDIIFRKNLLVDVSGNFQNATKANVVEWGGNNYFMADKFLDTSEDIFDTGTSTTMDPMFMDAASGNLKLGNQALIDAQVGDPRWW